MSDFRTVAGFEDVWRPPVRPIRKRPEGRWASMGGAEVRARLARIAARTPEVMVKVTGRTRDPAHLAAHLTYLTRNGDLAAEGRDGQEVIGRGRCWSWPRTGRRSSSPTAGGAPTRRSALG